MSFTIIPDGPAMSTLHVRAIIHSRHELADLIEKLTARLNGAWPVKAAQPIACCIHHVPLSTPCPYCNAPDQAAPAKPADLIGHEHIQPHQEKT